MFEYWLHVYEQDLKNLYTIYLEEHHKNDKMFKRVIPFYVFCKVVYNQSSQKINKYDIVEDEEDVEFI